MKLGRLESLSDRVRSLFRQLDRGRRRQLGQKTLPALQCLEGRTLLASVMDFGPTLQIELQQGERVEVVSNGTNYELTSTTSTFTNVGVTDAEDFSAFGAANLILTDLAQYTNVQITDAASGASVRFPDRGTGDFSHNFDIVLDDAATPPSIVINGPAHFGTHNFTVNTDGSILVFNGSDLSVSDGDISLTAVNATDGSAAPKGISVVDGKITTTGSGGILLTGTGASSAELNGLNGVSVEFNSLISSTSTMADAGTIVLSGTGGVGADFVNGVYLEESTLASANGDISVIGIGGNGSGNSQYGIRTKAATIESTGTGDNAAKILLNGTAGDADSFLVGLGVFEGSAVRSVDGDISWIGRGGSGTGGYNAGVRADDFVLESTGTGANAATITVHGIGGSGTHRTEGARLDGDTSAVRSVDGAIVLTGEGGEGASDGGNDGIWVATSVLAMGAASIQINGTGGVANQFSHGVSIQGTNTLVSSLTAPITINGTGGNTVLGRNPGVKVELSATVVSDTGPIQIIGAGGNGGTNNEGVGIKSSATIRSTGIGASAATIVVDGAAGNGEGFNVGVLIIGDSLLVSVDGEVSVKGRGGNGGSNNEGVGVKNLSTIRSTGTGPNAATIVVDGTSGSGDRWNVGVAISGGAALESVDGDVGVLGTGGDGFGDNNRGINLSGFERIASTGIGQHAAKISLTGIGGNGAAFNHGILTFKGDDDASLISSVDGNITLTASAGDVLTENANSAIYASNPIQSIGDGNITIDGTATFGTSNNRGVQFANSHAVSTNSGDLSVTGVGGRGSGNQNEGVVVNREATLTTHTGLISLNGTSGTNNSHGVEIWGNAESGGKVLSTGSGSIEIIAGGEGTGEKDDFRAYTNAVIGGPTAAGDISIKSDTMTLSENVAIQSSGNLVIAPMTDGLETQAISLGFKSAVSRTDLNLTDDELRRLHPGFTSITFGTLGLADNRNPVTVESVQLPPETTVVADMITLVDTNKPGRLQLAGDALFDAGTAFTVEVAGVQPGAGSRQHDQIVATGAVDIQAGAELDISRAASWRPAGSEQITIVSRNGGSGTFAGLAEGTVLPEFLNSTISYVGGDGDDIVLTLPAVVATQQTQIHNLPAGAGANLRPLISWDAVAGADSFRVFIGNSTQQTRVLDTIVSDTSMTPDVDLAFGRNLIWVQPIGGEFVGVWSAAKGHSVAPQLLSPTTSTLSARPEFTWAVMPGVDSVQIYIQKGSTVVVNESGVTGSSYIPSVDLEAGNYKWWVRPSAAVGAVGEWSACGIFNVGGQTPILGPVSTIDTGVATVEWEHVDGAAWYEIYLLNDDTGIVHRQSGLSTTCFDTAPLDDGDYRAWVRSYHSNGSPALWSRTHSFTVSSPAGNLNAAITDPVVSTFASTPTLAWTADAAATSFNLYLTNGDTVIQQTGVSDLSWTPGSELTSAVWEWWVQPVTAAGAVGQWSSRGTVDTTARAVLSDTVTVDAEVVTLNWNTVVGAGRYILQITNVATEESVVREENLTSLSFTTSGALDNGTYRAWVRAVSSSGELASWSFGLRFSVT